MLIPRVTQALNISASMAFDVLALVLMLNFCSKSELSQPFLRVVLEVLRSTSYSHVVNDPMTQRDLADLMTQLDVNDPA